jgi:hypothetical protein
MTAPDRNTPVRPHRCASCGVIGRLSPADPDPADPRPVLRISPKGPPRLICSLCRDQGDAP